jgi:peptide/nickel transport system permease protein
MIGLAIATPYVAPQEDPANPQNFQKIGRGSDTLPRPPNEKALLGTLSGQFDVMYTLLWGLRQALFFGISVTLITATFGVLYGAISGYLGGMTNNVMMRVADAFLAFPVLAAIVFMNQIVVILLDKAGIFYDAYHRSWFFLGSLTAVQQFLINADPVMWALILLLWMPYARLMNSSVIRLRNADYVLSARALGAGHKRIILRHLLPNTISPAIVFAARDVGGIVVLQATFTFIGLGGNSPWGELLNRARNWIVGPGGNPLVYWWSYLPATLLLIIFCVSWNYIGDSLNEWLNPHKLA